MSQSRSILIAATVGAALLLAACGEKPQTAATPRSDVAPNAGTGVASFTTAGWKAGDKPGWEGALKARMQLGQNEYSRAAAAPAAK